MIENCFWQWLIPAFTKYEVGKGFASTWGSFIIAQSQFLRQVIDLAKVADGNDCHWLVTVGNFKKFAYLRGVIASHLMYVKSEVGGLNAQVRDGLTEIVVSEAIGGGPLRVHSGNRDNEGRDIFCPQRVAPGHCRHKFLVEFSIRLIDDDEVPGLAIAAGWRPSCRFKQA